MEHLEQLITGLAGKNMAFGCDCMNELLALSEQSDCVYRYMDSFFTMLDSPNSFVRTRGLLLIVKNAAWDEKRIIDRNIGRLLLHITDKKPITARQFIQALPELAKYKPALKSLILAALQTADLSEYSESMVSLVASDIQNALSVLQQG